MRSIFYAKPDPLELRLRTAGFRQLGVWLPPLFALFIIAIESTDTFSASNTSNWLRPLFERVFGPFTDIVWWSMHHLFRKAGHVCGYGLVCLTFLRAWLLTVGRRADLRVAAWRMQSSGLAVASTALIASLDEWHQTFIPSRTGLASDVLIDTSGALLTCALVWLVCWRRPGHRSHRERR